MQFLLLTFYYYCYAALAHSAVQRQEISLPTMIISTSSLFNPSPNYSASSLLTTVPVTSVNNSALTRQRAQAQRAVQTERGPAPGTRVLYLLF